MDFDELAELIRQKAYEIWEMQGCPQGQDITHWLQAEREVLGELQGGEYAEDDDLTAYLDRDSIEANMVEVDEDVEEMSVDPAIMQSQADLEDQLQQAEAAGS